MLVEVLNDAGGTVKWYIILLKYDCAHVKPYFFPYCWNEETTKHFIVLVSIDCHLLIIIIFKEILSPNSTLAKYTSYFRFFYTWLFNMFMMLLTCPKTTGLPINMATQMEVHFIPFWQFQIFMDTSVHRSAGYAHLQWQPSGGPAEWLFHPRLDV